MKHFLLLMALLLLAYGLWVWTSPRQHAAGCSRLRRHGPRILAMGLLGLALLLAAYFFPAFKLL
jgi:hypothetical protein